MMISLIANSGIQLHTVPLYIDFENRDQNLLFHEWFDEELVQFNLELASHLKNNKITIKRSQLESIDFVDAVSGELKVDEGEVLSVPNLTVLHNGEVKSSDELFYMNGSNRHSKLQQLINKWIMVPYFELDSIGELKLGPYNWCRCKVIPKEMKETYLEGTLLLAFDTHTTYGEAETNSECPVFESESEKSKDYSFCNRPGMILDFCSGDNTWVRDALMELVHNVNDMDDIHTDISKGEHKYDFLATYIWLMDYISKNVEVPEIRLIRDRGVSNIPVEMIIDIGNSRTAAILYEGDFSKVEPLSLQNFDSPIDVTGQLNKVDESFDMRVAFQKVNFGYNMIGSQQFVWPSMVRLGTEARQLTYRTSNLTEGDELFSTYSSPKRYLWDNKKRKEEWRCVRGENGENERPEIPGISNFFADDGNLDQDELGYGFHYSRKTLMTLAFIEIVAQTNVQINSYRYRSHRGKPSTGRFLDKVILTCPTGMSKVEQQSLHDCLQNALYVLGKFYHNYDDSYEPYEVSIEPNLKRETEDGQWIYDEATCSQFVFLYGLLTETYQNCSRELFKIYGNKRDGIDSIIIGSLDIGAGTSDIMVCRYDYNSTTNPSRMKPVPLFWDSFDIAGDDMLQVLISNVLLQGKDGLLEKELINRGEDEEVVRAKLFDFFGKDQITHSFIDKNLRRDFNLQVLVPIMYEFLRLHTEGEGARDVSYTDIFETAEPSEDVLNKFLTVFGFELKEMVWHYDRETLSRHIAASMDERLLQKVAGVMAGYGCDLVLLSGRPTSLDPIREAFLSHAPVRTPDRLICLNKYEIGDWYPFIDKAHRRINNSKSVVPIGAMIGYLASNAGGLNGFSLDLSELSRLLKPTTNYFLKNDAKVKVNPWFMVPGKRTGEMEATSFPIYIGSRQYDLGIYPVRPFYVLDVDKDGIANKIKSDDKSLNEHQAQKMTEQKVADLLQGIPLTVTFARDDKEDRETLELESIKNVANEDLSTADFILSIQSLNDPDCYWLDSGVFDINRAK